MNKYVKNTLPIALLLSLSAYAMDGGRDHRFRRIRRNVPVPAPVAPVAPAAKEDIKPDIDPEDEDLLKAIALSEKDVQPQDELTAEEIEAIMALSENNQEQEERDLIQAIALSEQAIVAPEPNLPKPIEEIKEEKPTPQELPKETTEEELMALARELSLQKPESAPVEQTITSPVAQEAAAQEKEVKPVAVKEMKDHEHAGDKCPKCERRERLAQAALKREKAVLKPIEAKKEEIKEEKEVKPTISVPVAVEPVKEEKPVLPAAPALEPKKTEAELLVRKPLIERLEGQLNNIANLLTSYLIPFSIEVAKLNDLEELKEGLRKIAAKLNEYIDQEDMKAIFSKSFEDEAEKLQAAVALLNNLLGEEGVFAYLSLIANDNQKDATDVKALKLGAQLLAASFILCKDEPFTTRDQMVERMNQWYKDSKPSEQWIKPLQEYVAPKSDKCVIS